MELLHNITCYTYYPRTTVISTYNRPDRVYLSNYHGHHQQHKRRDDKIDWHLLELKTIPNAPSVEVNRLILVASLHQKHAVLRISLRMERDLMRKLGFPGGRPFPRPRATPQAPPSIPQEHRLPSNPPRPIIPQLYTRRHDEPCLPVLIPMRLADVRGPGELYCLLVHSEVGVRGEEGEVGPRGDVKFTWRKGSSVARVRAQAFGESADGFMGRPIHNGAGFPAIVN